MVTKPEAFRLCFGHKFLPAALNRPHGHPRPGAGTVGLPPMSTTVTAKTLAQKLWDSHVVREGGEEPDLLYVDLHLIHEVTSPQAFEGLHWPDGGCGDPI